MSAHSSKKTVFSFEKSMQQLQELVEQMSQGSLPLDQSLKHFEQGIQLARACRQALTDAEQRVEQVLKTQEGIETSSFEPLTEDN